MFDPDTDDTENDSDDTDDFGPVGEFAGLSGLALVDAMRDRIARQIIDRELAGLADPFLSPLRELAALPRATAGWDAGDASDGELRAVVLAVESARNTLDALSLSALAEFDARGVTDRVDGMRTGAWLARETATATGLATRRVRLATKLRAHLPDVADALADGRIGVHHAQVLADAANPRIVDDFAVVVHALVDLAGQMPFEAWKTRSRRRRRVVGRRRWSPPSG